MLIRNMSKHVMFRLILVSAILITQSAVTAMPRYSWTNNPAENKFKEIQSKTPAENIMEEITEGNSSESDTDSNEFMDVEPSTSVIAAEKPPLKVTVESTTLPSNEPVIIHGHKEITDEMEDTTFLGNILNTDNDPLNPTLAILIGALDTLTDNPIFTAPIQPIPFKPIQMDPIVSITAIPIIAMSYLQPIIFIKYSDIERFQEQNFENSTFIKSIISAIKDVIMVLPTLATLPTSRPTEALLLEKLNSALELTPSETVILEESPTTLKISTTRMPRDQQIREYVRRRIKENRENRAKTEYTTIFSNNPIVLSGRNFATHIETPEVTTSIEKAILTSTETLIPPMPTAITNLTSRQEATELIKPTETTTLATLTENTPIDTTTLTATPPLATPTNNTVSETSTETIMLTTPTETTTFTTPTQTTLITPIEMTTLTTPTETTTLIMATEPTPAEVTTPSEMTTFSIPTQTNIPKLLIPTSSVETTSIQSTLTTPTEKAILTTLTETTSTDMAIVLQSEEMEQRKRTKRTRENKEKNKQKPKLATILDPTSAPKLTEETTLTTPTETTLTTPIETKALTTIEKIKEFAHDKTREYKENKDKIENAKIETTKNTDNHALKAIVNASINKLTLRTPGELTTATEVITSKQREQVLKEFIHKRVKGNLENETKGGNMFATRKVDHMSSTFPASRSTPKLATKSSTPGTMLTETSTERDLKIKEFMHKRIKDTRRSRPKLGNMLTFQNHSNRQFSSTIVPTFAASTETTSRTRSRKLTTTMEIPTERTGRSKHDQKENKRQKEPRKNKKRTGTTDQQM